MLCDIVSATDLSENFAILTKIVYGFKLCNCGRMMLFASKQNRPTNFRQHERRVDKFEWNWFCCLDMQVNVIFVWFSDAFEIALNANSQFIFLLLLGLGNSKVYTFSKWHTIRLSILPFQLSEWSIFMFIFSTWHKRFCANFLVQNTPNTQAEFGEWTCLAI